MKKREKVSLESLKEELKRVEIELEKLEDERDNVMKDAHYMGGRPFSIEEIEGRGGAPYERYSHSFSLMMTDADYIALDIRELEVKRDALKKQINKLEEENAPAGLGG